MDFDFAYLAEVLGGPSIFALMRALVESGGMVHPHFPCHQADLQVEKIV